MGRKIEDNLSENQFAFRKNRGTREDSLSGNHSREIYTCEQATVCGVRGLGESLRQCGVVQAVLENLGIDFNDRRIIYQLYKKQVVTMRMRDGSCIEAKINKGVR
jgi:hypothetical protein